MKNQDIRQEIRESGFKYWQVAEMFGTSPGWFSCLLRNELSDDKKARIRTAIAELKAGE